MKKVLLTSFLLSLCGAAQAQSSVTLYGGLDTGYRYDKTDNARSTSGIQSGSNYQSRWGMRGTEDLGGGLSALFILESAINVDDGTQFGGRLFNRAAVVGLASKTYGSFRLGRTTHLGFEWAANIISPTGLGFSRSSVGTTFGYQDAEFGAGRVSNSAYYYSPVMAGFDAAIGYSFAVDATEVAGSSNNNRMTDAGLRYVKGPLRAVLTYQYLQTVNTATNRNPQNLTTGATWDFGPFAVFGGYGRLHNSTGTTGGVINDNAYSVGFQVPFGASTVKVAYQKATSSKLDNTGIAYTYDMSKRTQAYAFLNVGDSAGTPTNRLEQRQAGFGLVHKF